MVFFCERQGILELFCGLKDSHWKEQLGKLIKYDDKGVEMDQIRSVKDNKPSN